MKQVFIGGCGRSGTTFLAALINRNTKSIVTPESQFKFDLLSRPNESGVDYLRLLENNWRFGNWGLDVHKLASEVGNVSSLSEFLTVIVKEYGGVNGGEGADVWIDHTPNNIDYMIPLDNIFPEAKFIHLIRDGRGVAASVMPLPWGPNTVLAAADWWMKKLAVGLAAEQFFGADRVLRVRYEDLITNVSETIDSIIGFLGLRSAIYVDKNESEMFLPEFTRTQHSLVNAPPEKSRIDGWKETLTERQIQLFELKAMNLMQYLGYERYTEGVIQPMGTYESLKMKFGNLFRKNLKNKWGLYHRNARGRDGSIRK